MKLSFLKVFDQNNNTIYFLDFIYLILFHKFISKILFSLLRVLIIFSARIILSKLFICFRCKRIFYEWRLMMQSYITTLQINTTDNN